MKLGFRQCFAYGRRGATVALIRRQVIGPLRWSMSFSRRIAD